MQRHELKMGATYTVSGGKFPGFWKLTKINSVNCALVNEDSAQTLRAHPSFLTEVPSGVERPVLNLTDLPLTPGTVVKSLNNFKISGLHVVTRVNDRTHTIIPLGGKGNGWRVSRNNLEVIPVEELASHL